MRRWTFAVFLFAVTIPVAAQTFDPDWSLPQPQPMRTGPVPPRLPTKMESGRPITWFGDQASGIQFRVRGSGGPVLSGKTTSTGSQSMEFVRRQAALRPFGFWVTGEDPFLFSAPLTPPAGADEAYLQLDSRAKTTSSLRLYWMKSGQGATPEQSIVLPVPATDRLTSRVFDLRKNGPFDGAESFKLVPLDGMGQEVDNFRVKLLRAQDLPSSHPVFQVPVASQIRTPGPRPEVPAGRTHRGILWRFRGSGASVSIAASIISDGDPKEVQRLMSSHWLKIRVHGENAELFSVPVYPPAGPNDYLLRIDTRATTPGSFRLYWMEKGQEPAPERSVLVHVPAPGHASRQVVDLSSSGHWHGAEQFKIEIIEPPAWEFSLRTAFQKLPPAACQPARETFP